MNESEARAMLERTWSDLHEIPEPGDQTPKSCAYLAKKLEEYGYQVDANVGGGVVGILDSKNPGPHFALRADTDALEFYVDGEMKDYHGCCHDGHMSILLTAAKSIAEDGIQRGKLYIIFQPGEEPNVGAKTMIETGKLTDIEEICALHLVPNADVPEGKVASLLLHNGLGTLKAVIRGKNAHASVPHTGINAAEAGVLAVNAANMLRYAPDKNWSCKLTQFIADKSSDNTIPDYAQIVFDLRAENNELLEEITAGLKRAIDGAVRAVGAEVENYEFVFDPAPDYDEELAIFAEKTICEVLGENACAGRVRTSPGEDFHFYSYLGHMKTAYMAVGAGVTPALHIYNNTFNHEALYRAYRLLLAMAHKKLG